MQRSVAIKTRPSNFIGSAPRELVQQTQGYTRFRATFEPDAARIYISITCQHVTSDGTCLVQSSSFLTRTPTSQLFPSKMLIPHNPSSQVGATSSLHANGGPIEGAAITVFFILIVLDVFQVASIFLIHRRLGISIKIEHIFIGLTLFVGVALKAVCISLSTILRARNWSLTYSQDMIKYSSFDGIEFPVTAPNQADAILCSNAAVTIVSLYSFVTVLPRITILINMSRDLLAWKSARWSACILTIVLTATNVMASMTLMTTWCKSIGLLQNLHANKRISFATTTAIAILVNVFVVVLKIACVKWIRSPLSLQPSNADVSYRDNQRSDPGSRPILSSFSACVSCQS